MNPTAARARREALARQLELDARRTHDPVAEARREAELGRLEEDFPAPEVPEHLRDLGPNIADTWRSFTAGYAVLPDDYLAAVGMFCVAVTGGRRGGVSTAAVGRGTGLGGVDAALEELRRTEPVRYLP